MSELKYAAVLVLGDLNRSPRMLNHAKAISTLMEDIKSVSLIGYDGGDLRGDIKNDKKINPVYINLKIISLLSKLPRVFFPIVALIKIILQCIYLIYTLLTIPRPSFLILQNPPGIPAIYICSVICAFRGTKFILDWHNYGFTILKVNKRNSLICKLAWCYERLYGNTAHLGLCVSEAMREDLKRFNVNAVSLPDRAMPEVFNCSRLNAQRTRRLFSKYSYTFTIDRQSIDEVFFKIDTNGNILWRDDRPIIMVSSTSWTPDEDFDILLNTFCRIDNDSRKVLFLITGRGPLKDAFMMKVQKANLKRFIVRSLWLDSDDYPLLLSSVDLGVCLHYSSSGFDLPMKVVDMFSAGLPVLAMRYNTITELVKEGQHGFLFKDSSELSDLMPRLIESFKGSESQTIEEMRKNIQRDFKEDWVKQWSNRLEPRIRKLMK